MLFAPKNDEKLRLCVKCRKLNAMTVEDTYPLPCMDEFIQSLGDAALFLQLTDIGDIGKMRYLKQTMTKQCFPAIMCCSDLSECRSD